MSGFSSMSPSAEGVRALPIWRRTLQNRGFLVVCLAATSLSVLMLAVLMVSILLKGWAFLDLQFLSDFPSRKPEKAGFRGALMGSLWVCAVCAFSALPLGVGTAVFLEEYKPRSRLLRRLHGFVQLNITNLAGVPSIVYGIIGFTAFARMFGLFGTVTEPAFEIGSVDSLFYFRLPFGGSVLTGGLTLMLVVLPIVIVSAQEALRAVPDSLREGALAAGATRWQMVSRMTLPAAIPGIMTGAILAMSRAIGEAAPLLVIGGFLFVQFVPNNLMDDFAAMPLQIYNWAGRPQDDFRSVAAAGIVVLLTVLLVFNGLAIFIRQKLQKPLN